MIKKVDGWYCCDKSVDDGTHYIRGPFDEKITARAKSCKGISGTFCRVVDKTGRSNRSMHDVRENFSGSS